MIKVKSLELKRKEGNEERRSFYSQFSEIKKTSALMHNTSLLGHFEEVWTNEKQALT
jgi:hypothetical protein